MKIFILITDITDGERKMISEIQSLCNEMYLASNHLYSDTTNNIEYAYITSDFMHSVNVMAESDLLIHTYLPTCGSHADAMEKLADHLKKTIIDHDKLCICRAILKTFRMKGDQNV